MQTWIVTLSLVLSIVGLLAVSGRRKITARVLAQIAVCAALCVVLDFLAVYRLPQGGSITLGKMVPLLLLANVAGWRAGLIGGAIVALLDFLVSPFIVHPVQFMLDYPLAYMVLAVSGIFPNNRLLGGYMALVLRFLCHFLSGAVFFGSYAPAGTNPWLYSFYVNAPWMAIEGSIAVIIYRLLPMKMLRNFSR